MIVAFGNGDNTYSNYQEAQRSFWRQTVLPLVNRTAKAFAMWLGPAWGGALELRPDLDQVEALSSEREALWARLERTTFLTANEKRAAVGYGPIAAGDASSLAPVADVQPFPASGATGAGALAALMKFDPNQPRVPRGSTGGGQWTDGGGGGGVSTSDSSVGRVLSDANRDDDWQPGTQLAQAENAGPYRVDLLEEAVRGGHTHSDHVGKTPELLTAHVRQESAKFIALGVKATRLRVGSFPSLEAASKLTNSTLAQNRARVELVARGDVKKDFVTATFNSATGTEAYAKNVREEPSVRETFGVGVVIVHDPQSKNGFTVISAYPRNDD